MKPAHYTVLTCTDGVQLPALLFGSLDARVGFVFMHGLGSSIFSKHDLLPVDVDHMALFIQNRGHDTIAFMKRSGIDGAERPEAVLGGAAHEIFTESVHDVDAGVRYLHERGCAAIYVVGHSTGCQKSIYYATHGPSVSLVKGIILLCPMSDYAGIQQSKKPARLRQATSYAEKLVAQNEPHTLLPAEVWPETIDAQRFLSLYTPTSEEEVFCYCQPEKTPKLLKNVRLPLLILIAENDEYADRPTDDIANWFATHTANAQVSLIPTATHNLSEQSAVVQQYITKWVSPLTHAPS